MSLSEKIFNYIKAKPGTTFAEIEWIFERNGFDYEGDLGIVGEYENLILWGGWNKEAYSVFEELITNYQIVQEPVDKLMYVIDGNFLPLPVAKRYQKRAKPAWYPISLIAK